MAHGFAIFMGHVGTLQSLRSFRRRLPWALGLLRERLPSIQIYSAAFMNLAEAAIAHLSNLLGALPDLQAQGIALHEHQYDGLSFGSFVLVLAKSHSRVRFSWDGREHILAIEFQDIQSQSDSKQWIHDAFISLPEGSGVIEEIASNASSMLE